MGRKTKAKRLETGFELIYKYRFVLSFLLLIMLVSFKNNFQHPMDDPLILNETNMINSKNDNTKRYL